jgi:hypothetical protein
MSFYLLKRNYGLERTTIREIFFEKASAQRKDSVEVARYERPYSTFGLRGVICPGDYFLPSLFRPAFPG